MKNKKLAVARNREYAARYFRQRGCACCATTESLQCYVGARELGNTPIWEAVNQGTSIATLVAALSKGVIVCEGCLNDVFSSSDNRACVVGHLDYLETHVRFKYEGREPELFSAYLRYDCVSTRLWGLNGVMRWELPPRMSVDYEPSAFIDKLLQSVTRFPSVEPTEECA